MKQIIINTILLISGTFLLLSCADVRGKQIDNNRGPEFAIVEIDGNDVLLRVNRDVRGEIVVDDKALKQMNQVINTSARSSINESKRLIDSSQVTTMNDGYGNKVETRTFEGDSRIKQVVVRSFVNGNVRVFVYGANGEVRGVPDDFQGKVLTASAREIADAAKIVEHFEEPKPQISQIGESTTNTTYPDPRSNVQYVERSGEPVGNRASPVRSAETKQVPDPPLPDQAKSRSDKVNVQSQQDQ
ncbi:MAG: hypothetical protein KDB79_10635 [Acidobacteria bacterium]|nr:hypothetical protein [Acidobacteriota bacterium]